MFDRLVELIHRDSKKSPLPDSNNNSFENFTTEILIEILKSDQDIMDGYVNEVLEITGSNFKIETKLSPFKMMINGAYTIIEKDIDIIFTNKETVVFQKNDVGVDTDYKEEIVKLNKYSNTSHLMGKKNFALRYCSKYYYFIHLSEVDFKHFRWIKIYKYLKKYADNNKLIEYFIKCLRDRMMFLVNEFTPDDLKVLPKIIEIISKTNDAIAQGSKLLEEKFVGEISNVSVKDIINKSGLYFGIKNILPGGECQINIGIHYTHHPEVYVHIYIEEEHEKYKAVRKYFSKLDDYDLSINDEEAYTEIYYRELLGNFTPDNVNKNIRIDIINYYKRSIRQFYNYCKNSKLDWSIK